MNDVARAWLRLLLWRANRLHALEAAEFTLLAERLSERRRAIQKLQRRISTIGAYKPSRKLELVDLYRKNEGA